MGLVGGYVAHFYCDSCNTFAELGQVQTLEEALKAAAGGQGGWLFREDGVVLCEECKKLPNPPIIPEDDREGWEWNFKDEEQI